MNKTNKLNSTNNTLSQSTNKTVMSKTNGTFYSNSANKRVYSSNPQRSELVQKIYKVNKSNLNQAKTKSAEPVSRQDNNIIQTFVNGQGFGFNYYLDDKTPNIQVVQNKEKDLSKDSLKEDDINSEIDKLLNFYMSQLKESINKHNR